MRALTSTRTRLTGDFEAFFALLGGVCPAAETWAARDGLVAWVGVVAGSTPEFAALRGEHPGEAADQIVCRCLAEMLKAPAARP